MKLFYSTTSPYARKVRVTALEKGLTDRIELRHCNPHAPEPELLAANPMGRVPTLVLDSGESLFDSPVICEWLDELAEQPRLIPPSAPERWAVLRGQALADGMLDDAVAIVLERRRPEVQQNADLLAARSAALMRCVDALESTFPDVAAPLSLAHIAQGCALGYLDFRLPELDWRTGHQALTRWFEGFSQRPAMTETGPQLPPA